MSGYHNTNYNLPSDFDWIAYRSLNHDLHFIVSRQDAVKHYKQHGYRQNRRYTFEEEHPSVDTASTPTSASTIIKPILPLSKLSDPVRVVDVYQNRLNGVPDQFDWLAYKSLNHDLRFLKSYMDAVKHYLEHGHYQQRPYQFPQTLDPEPISQITYLDNDIKANQLLEMKMSEINYTELNQQNGVPNQFNWQVYKSCNPDLHIKTYQEAVAHYREHGHRESRKYCVSQPPASELVPEQSASLQPQPQIPSIVDEALLVPKDFDWLAYKSLNQDLSSLNSRADAVRHYLKYGQQEGRKYHYDLSNGDGPQGPVLFEKVTTDYDWISYRPVGPHRETMDLETFSSTVEVPKNFDWRAYKMRNPDLIMINSQADAIKHYKEHGYKDHRPYVMELTPTAAVGSCPPSEAPSGFNWIYYRAKYPDLKYLITNEQEAIQHYLQHGQREQRKYAPNQEEITPLCPHPPPHSKKPRTRRDVTSKPQSTTPAPAPAPLRKTRMVISNSAPGQPRIVSSPVPTPGTIPNIIHFIYGFKSQTSEFGVTQYVAIMSAYHLNKPDRIYFHYHYQPFGPLWDRVKPYLTLVETEPPTQIFDKRVTRYAHQADIVRLTVLNQMGGIYLDIDTICLRPLTPYLQYDFVMGIQGENYGLCNAVMLAKPQTPFGDQWYQSYQSFTQNWDLHSVKIPLGLSKVHPITIVPNDAFFYPLWDPFPELVLSETINYDCCHRLFQNSYCLHLWETWCGRYLQKTNLDTLWSQRSLYHLLARKFVENPITIFLIVNGSPEATITAIGSWYPAAACDEISRIMVYDGNTGLSQDPQLREYLTHLPEINPKFQIIHADDPKDPKDMESPVSCKDTMGHIKKELCARVTRGIIGLVEMPWILPSLDWLLQVRDLLYDESIGMVGGTANANVSVTNTKFGLSLVDCATTCQVFRSELMEYGIQFKADLSDRDVCQQIHDLGKSVCVLNST